MRAAPPNQTDVLVIGGGPAGSLAAGLLSQKGFEVCLLEKAKHPRAVIGESAIPHFWRYVDMLGDAAEKIQAAKFVRKSGAIVHWDGVARRIAFKDYGFDRAALHIDRDAFDKILLDECGQCGARVFERTMVTRVELADDDDDWGVVHYRSVDGDVTGKIKARYILDASGQGAVVSKQFGIREFDQQLRNTAMWGYYKRGDFFDYEGKRHPFSDRFDVPPVTFISNKGEGMWSWHITLREKVSVGVVMSIDRMKSLKAEGGSLEERFRRLIPEIHGMRRLQNDADLIEGSVTGMRDYAYKPVELAMGNCYLLGDAAAFVDPINSAGLTFAMYSAYLAAWSVETSLNNPARRKHCRDMYAFQFKRRLNIFRLVSVPGDTPLQDADWADLVKAFKLYSLNEQRLALGTTILTGRSDRVLRLMQELGLEEHDIFAPMPDLISSL